MKSIITKNVISLFNGLESKKALLVVALLCMSVMLSHSQISLSMEKTTLGSVIESIKKQSSYQFFYEDNLANIPVDKINVQNRNVNEVLETALKGKDISYTVEDNVIYLKSETSAKETTLEKTLTGIVVDRNGDPLIGVSISVKGTTRGTATDVNGKYTIKIPAGNIAVEFSYLGYKHESLNPKGKNVLDVTMLEDSQIIDEVVVTALGIKRDKKMLGYAIQEVKARELNETGNPSAIGALQGKVAGMQMNISPTGLNGSTKITLRGNTSLTDQNQPLWVIDGVPFSDENKSTVSLYKGVDRGGASIDLNPEDIESISVLKGVNAAALYGSRAGNGVILVTTKKGVKSKGFGLNYSTTLTWTDVSQTLRMQRKYGQGMNGAYSNSTPFSYGGALDGSPTTAWWEGANGATVPYSNYGNKIKDYFDTGFSQNHNVSFGNVTDKSSYRASFGYLDSKGIFDKENLEKINMDLNSSMEANKYLNLETKISLSKTKAVNRPNLGKTGEMYQLLFLPNNIRLNDLQAHYLKQEKSDGQTYNLHQNWFGPTQDILNPYFVNKQRTNMDERWRVFGYQTVNVNFTDWLHARGRVSIDYYRTKLEDTDLSQSRGLDEVKYNDNFQKGEENYMEMNTEFLVFGSNKITDKIRVDYTFGGNRMRYKNETLTVNARNMAKKDYWYINSAGQGIDGIPTYANQSLTRKKVNSLLGSFQIAYDEYLSLDVTGRNDWSSALPKDKRSYFYPSVNLGFIGSEFFNRQDWKIPTWLDFAKLRLSYAKVGNDTKPQNLFNYNRWNQSYTGPLAVQDTELANRHLKPEMSYSYEVGLDAKFFKNRLGFDFTYYHSSTKDQIMRVGDTAAGGGYNWKWINAGEILNEGIELAIYSTPVKLKDFEFGLDVNLSHNKSTVQKLYPGSTFMDFSKDKFFFTVGAEEGGTLGSIYANRVYERNDKGDIIINSDGLPRIKSTKREKIGSIQPKLLASFTPRFTYKNFSLSALFDMRFGGDIVSVSEAIATHYGTSKRTLDREGTMVIPGVTASGEPNSTPVSKQTYYQFIGTAGGSEGGIPQEFIYDASYIKLREVALGYSFSQKLLSKTPFTGLRLSFVARNLCYLMKHTPGTSPEGGFDTSMYSQAFDYVAVPSTRTLGFTINVGF